MCHRKWSGDSSHRRLDLRCCVRGGTNVGLQIALCECACSAVRVSTMGFKHLHSGTTRRIVLNLISWFPPRFHRQCYKLPKPLILKQQHIAPSIGGVCWDPNVMHCPSITIYLPWVTFSNLRTAIPLMMWFSSISWSSEVFQTVFSGSLFFRFVLKLTVSSFPYAINVQPKPKTSEKAMHPRTQNFILANVI